MGKELRLNLGAGGNHLPSPWKNYDLDLDISKPLPFGDGEAKYVVASHVLEHLTLREAWGFFEESFRVLQGGGVLRIAVPDVVKIWMRADESYRIWLVKNGFGQATKKDQIANIALNHGHQHLWSADTLQVCLLAIGFRRVSAHDANKSDVLDLRNTDKHDTIIGQKNNWIETTCVDAVK